jgi:WD40 repeat protein
MVTSVAFSPDRQRLAAGSWGETIRIWIAYTEILAEMVCEKVWRNLTWDEWRQFVSADLLYKRTCPNWPPGQAAPPAALASGSPK